MEHLQARYEGVDHVLGYIGKLINLSRRQENSSTRMPTAGRDVDGSVTLTSAPSVQVSMMGSREGLSLSDAIVVRPRQYLRVNMMVDLALCRGDFPQDFELPSILLSVQPRPHSQSPVTPNAPFMDGLQLVSQPSHPDHGAISGDFDVLLNGEDNIPPDEVSSEGDATSRQFRLEDEFLDFESPKSPPVQTEWASDLLTLERWLEAHEQQRCP